MVNSEGDNFASRRREAEDAYMEKIFRYGGT